MQKGMQQGLQRGLRQGRQEGERSLVLRLLNRRIGEIGRRMQNSITKLPIAQIEALSEALLDFTSTDDLKRWLDENEVKTPPRRATKSVARTKSKKRI